MKKRIVTGFVVCAIVILSYFYSNIDYNSYLYDRNADTATFYGTGVLKENEIITQSFVMDEDRIDGLNIKVAFWGDVNNIQFQCRILNEHSEEVSLVQVKASELEANKFNYIPFPTITGARGKQYTIELIPEQGDEINGVGFYVAPDKRDKQELDMNGNSIDGTLVMRIVTHRFDMETFLVLLGIISFVSVFMKMLYKIFK